MPRRQHGLSRTPEYIAWKDMRNRCSNPSVPNYEDYGGCGVRVCRRWAKFENFLADVGLRPSPYHSIDRYPDPHGNYEPTNVRWATQREQNLNQRRTRKLNGRPIFELGKHAGFNENTVRYRVRSGWPLEAIVSTPVRKKRVNLTPTEKRAIRSLYVKGMTQQKIADLYGIAQSAISEVMRNK
jgi:hypothetical protein